MPPVGDPAAPPSTQVLLQTSPYHVDSLLQLSDACRFQEDQEMARDLVGEPHRRPAAPGPSPFTGASRRLAAPMPFHMVTGYRWVRQAIFKVTALLRYNS